MTKGKMQLLVLLSLSGVLALIGGGGVYFLRAASRWEKRQTEELRQVCEALGFRFEPEVVQQLDVRFGDFPCFTRGGLSGRGRRLMSGSLADRPVTVMEHYYVSGGSETRGSETLAVFPDGAKGLPDFELTPGVSVGMGALGDKILAVFGYQQVVLSENEEFSKHYSLRGTDEAALRRAFDATTLAFFAANPGWSVQTRGGAVAISRQPRKLCAPAEVPGFLAEALTVLGGFTRR